MARRRRRSRRGAPGPGCYCCWMDESRDPVYEAGPCTWARGPWDAARRLGLGPGWSCAPAFQGLCGPPPRRKTIADYL